MAKKRKSLKDIRQRFLLTMEHVADLIGIDVYDVRRDDYIRTTVDFDVKDRLNKEEIHLLGGFKKAKESYFNAPEKEEEIAKPKVLVFDIETAPIIGYVWKLWKNDLGLNMIESDWHVMSWSAKWLDSNNVMYMDQRDSEAIEDDKAILEVIWDLLDQCDIVVTQNGKNFDQKKLNARFIMNGMQPPSSYRHIDTRDIARRHFGFTSNKLEYMTNKLCTKKKLKHAKFPGFELWKECLAGNIEAWDEMRDYNEMDVLSLEELFWKLIPWDNTVDWNLYHDEERYVCMCGSEEFRKAGFHRTQTGKYQKRVCKNCGMETRDAENLFSKEKRKSLRRRQPKQG